MKLLLLAANKKKSIRKAPFLRPELKFVMGNFS